MRFNTLPIPSFAACERIRYERDFLWVARIVDDAQVGVAARVVCDLARIFALLPPRV